MQSPISQQPIKIRSYIKSIMESVNKGNDNTLLTDWLAWPPDVFAVTSLILETTGAYIFSVFPPRNAQFPSKSNWQEVLYQAGQHWLDWMLEAPNIGSIPKDEHKYFEGFEKHWDTYTLDDIKHFIKDIKDIEDVDKDAIDSDLWCLCESILFLHILSDELCEGYGIPSSTSKYKDHSKAELYQSVKFIANTLLAYTGSLSRLPFYIIKVFPKLRAPNVGMTLRGLSRYLTAHRTEIDIQWRTMPWVNIDENVLNILIVPYPHEFEPTWFQPSTYMTKRASSEMTRYFTYTGPQEEFDAAILINLLAKAERAMQRIHLVVFPEQSITKENLDKILNKLAEEKSRNKLPMVVAGIREGKTSSELQQNKVILSTFFAGKWYQIEQSKHHRWKLNESQIKNYNLGGMLAASKEWWEAMQIPQRQLSVLAPNEWLTLCPLICEDLARQEPVSSIIRGIAPSLLIALLLDGPQLKDRWPARYATVFADDPGTSVLTVSALGIVKRSGILDGRAGNTTVSLWKDISTSAQEIKIETGEISEKHDLNSNPKIKKGLIQRVKSKGGVEAVALTISTRWTDAFTSDGRGGTENSSVFIAQGIHQIKSDVIINYGNVLKNQKGKPNIDTKGYPRSINSDLLEITIFSYFVDAVLDWSQSTLVDSIKRWALGIPKLDESLYENQGGEKYNLRARHGLKILVEDGTKKFVSKLIDPNAPQSPKPDSMEPYLDWFCAIRKYVIRDSSDKTKYYEVMAERVINILNIVKGRHFLNKLKNDNDAILAYLDNIQQGYLKREESNKEPVDDFLRFWSKKEVDVSTKVRIYIYTSLAILWGIHARLNDLRRIGALSHKRAILLHKIELCLDESHDAKWIEARAI